MAKDDKASRLGMAVGGVLLPIFVLGVLIYSWYIYVFRVCSALLLEREPKDTVEAVLFMIIACIFWLMTIFSYLRVLFSYPGKAIHALATSPLSSMERGSYINTQFEALPRFFYSRRLFDRKTMSARSLDTLDGNTSEATPLLSNCRGDGLPRYCEMCQCFKPDRTHHCRECNACILKMDHHCPWISGCVGHRNYKFFFLFVVYTGLYAIWVLCSALPLVVNAVTKERLPLDPQWVVLLVLGFLFGVILWGFAAVHLFYILRNQTTIEHISTRPNEVRVDFDTSGHNYEIVTTHRNDKLWDLGAADNWRAVMGNNPWGWFVPLYGGLGDGCVFPYNDHIYTKVIDRAKEHRAMLEPPPPIPHHPHHHPASEANGGFQ